LKGTPVNQDAADRIVLTTQHLARAIQDFILAREVFVKTHTMFDAERLIRALATMAEATSAATTQAVCAKMSAMAAEPFMVSLTNTMPGFLSHDTPANGHRKGFNGNLSHNTKLNGHAQQLHDIIRAR